MAGFEIEWNKKSSEQAGGQTPESDPVRIEVQKMRNWGEGKIKILEKEAEQKGKFRFLNLKGLLDSMVDSEAK